MQYKIRTILSGIDRALQDKKSEYLELPENLTIEHILPDKWMKNWSIPYEISADPEEKLGFINNRDQLKHTLGTSLLN